MRTTIDIDDPILKELKKLGKKQGKSIGRIISDLLAQALRTRKESPQHTEPPRWISRDMGARIPLNDKEALYAALDQQEPTEKKATNS